MDSNEISRPFFKAGTAVGTATIASTDAAGQAARAVTADSSYQTWMFINSIPWDSIAKISAAIYGLLVLSEWIWKKLARPWAESRGWIKAKPRRVLTIEDFERLQREDDQS